MNWLSYIGVFVVMGSLIYIAWQLIMKLVGLLRHKSSHKGFKKIGIGLLCLVVGVGLTMTYKETKSDIAADKKEARIESRKKASEKESSEKAQSESKTKAESKKHANSVSESKSMDESTSKAESSKKAKAKKESKAKATSAKKTKAKKESKAESKAKKESKINAKKESKAAKAASPSSKKNKNKKQSSSAKLNKKMQTAFKDIGGSDEYPLIGHFEVNHNGSEVTGVSVWGDESLETASPELLKHYFSAGAQVGNRLLGTDTGKVPFIQVYAGSKRVARSTYTNNSQMKDLR